MKIDLSEYPFHYKINTRWSDMDSFGHINHSKFLSYLEDARIFWARNWSLNEEKSIIVASIKVDYKKQLKHPSSITVGQKITRLGNSSFDIESAIYLNNSSILILMAKVTLVCYNYKLNKSIPILNRIIKDYKTK